MHKLPSVHASTTAIPSTIFAPGCQSLLQLVLLDYAHDWQPTPLQPSGFALMTGNYAANSYHMHFSYKCALALRRCRVLQADSSCQLSATAGGTTDGTASTENSGTASSDNIEWLKWTGAAVLFVEGLIVSTPCHA